MIMRELGRLGALGLLGGTLATVACSGILHSGDRGRDGAAPPASTAAGGELRLGGSEPPTLAPALAGDTSSATYIVEIFGGLVKLNDKLQVVPDIAKSWEVSSDGKTYAFQLREGVKFHDGKPVKAGDFKYSFERVANPKTQSRVTDYLKDIAGVHEMLDGKANAISGVTVKDDQTLQITTDQPKAYFLAKLTYPTAYVVDKDNVESGRGWFEKPNGTGPFKLSTWRKGERIVLERNDLFYDGPAKLGRVNFLLTGAGMTMYENNEVDISGVGLIDMDRVLDKNNPLNKELITGNSLDVFYIGFNVKMPPFDDVKVRQAFNHAVDKKRINDVVQRNRHIVAKGILPPGMPGYNQNLKGLDFDAAKAKQLLAESKYKSVAGLGRVTLSTAGSTAAVQPATEAVIQMWKDNLGVEVEIQQAEWATFLQDLHRKRYQVFDVGWIADYPDPENFVDLLFHSKSEQNNPQYSNPQVDSLLEKARGERDPSARLKIYEQVEQTLVDEAPWLPLWHSKSYVLVKSYVKNFKVPPMIIPYLKDVEIAGR